MREYFVGGFGPHERFAAFVPGGDERADGVDEFADAGEAAAADGLTADDGENTSTRFSQLPEVGVKCSWMRGLRASQRCTLGCLWVA